jgi:NitT/TauT family transport system substrate-binding protein
LRRLREADGLSWTRFWLGRPQAHLPVLTLNLALNKYAFHWSYPEILADEQGLYAKNEVEVRWRDATPRGVVNKTVMYTDLLKGRETDVYHAGEWACINRVAKSPGTWIIAKSSPGDGTLNSSFALYVRSDSAVRSPADLAGRPVAIEEGTGAQYTTINDLEGFLPRDEIKLMQVGEPHRRLLALLDGQVEAASLVGPWSDIGKALGLRMVLQTARKNPTTIVVRRDMDPELLRRYFRATNQAIGLVDEAPEKFRDSYLWRVEAILEEMSLGVPGETLRKSVVVSRWKEWERYTEEDFVRTYEWMSQRGMAPRGLVPSDKVASYPLDVFS